MHKLSKIIRDAEVAHAIHPVVLKYLMTWEETTAVLIRCKVPRANNVAYIATSRFFGVPAVASQT